MIVGALPLLLALAVPGQATVFGVVREAESGRPVAEAAVALTDLGRVRPSARDGRWQFEGVPAGPQHLTVTALGYTTRTLHVLVPPEGRVEVHVVLRPEPVELTGVLVRAPVAVRDVDAQGGRPGVRVVDAGALRTHPTLGERDALLALEGGAVAVAPEAPEGLHLRGGASDQVRYLLDGFPVLSPYHVAGLFGAFPPDALEQIEVDAAWPSTGSGHALSGAVRARTWTTADRPRTSANVSTTHLGASARGPIGDGGVWTGAVRRGFMGVGAAVSRSTRLGVEAGDALAAVRVPFAGGAVRLLAWGTEDEVGTPAVHPDRVPPGGDPVRHQFRWSASTLGLGWTRPGSWTVDVAAWRAGLSAGALWRPEDQTPIALRSRRLDHGGHVAAIGAIRGVSIHTGLRAERIDTHYHVASEESASFEQLATVLTAQLVATRRLDERIEAIVGGEAALSGGRVWLLPRVHGRWHLGRRMTLAGGFARTLQFAQSLRNPESMVGRIFPADLYVASGPDGTPVAQAGEWSLLADVWPTSGLHLRGQVWLRTLGELALTALDEPGPFARSGFQTGRGHARGAAAEMGLARARWGLLMSYGWSSARMHSHTASYRPEISMGHRLEVGAVTFPTPTLALRASTAAAFGRRSTRLATAFEWEGCNLVDGCEFVGAPELDPSALGALHLPAYVRVDVGARKHWHVRLHRREAELSLHGTVTNLFGRRNLLTWASDPTGPPVAVEMRPLSPLVLGLEWRF